MAKLLKVDLKRIFKDKLLLVVAIIGVVLALTTPLIYKFIYLFLGADDTGLLGSLLSIKTMFYSSFSASSSVSSTASSFTSSVTASFSSSVTISVFVSASVGRVSSFFERFG